MIWEQETRVVVMLTDFVEKGIDKCADYLPPSETLDCHRLYGDFQVSDTPGCPSRCICYLLSRTRLEVRHTTLCALVAMRLQRKICKTEHFKYTGVAKKKTIGITGMEHSRYGSKLYNI